VVALAAGVREATVSLGVGELVTAESLRWTATAAAVACHISENILRSLGGDAGPGSSDTGP
jgi:hypothetical protein